MHCAPTCIGCRDSPGHLQLLEMLTEAFVQDIGLFGFAVACKQCQHRLAFLRFRRRAIDQNAA